MRTHFIFSLHTTTPHFLVFHTRWSAPFLDDYYLYYPAQGVTAMKARPKRAFLTSLSHISRRDCPFACVFLFCVSLSPSLVLVSCFLHLSEQTQSCDFISGRKCQSPPLPRTEPQSSLPCCPHRTCISFRLDLLFQSRFSVGINLS